MLLFRARSLACLQVDDVDSQASAPSGAGVDECSDARELSPLRSGQRARFAGQHERIPRRRLRSLSHVPRASVTGGCSSDLGLGEHAGFGQLALLAREWGAGRG